MDKIYRKFLRSGIDLSSIGVERTRDQEAYFCTPKGASIFGWAGVDGVHFCFIRGFGDMVFAVSPMNAFPDYVHPLANNFEDFLRLLLACGDAAAVEQAWMWDKTQFDAFIRENRPTEEQQRVLAEIAEKMGLTPMERPWEYMKDLQRSFDYSKIKYTEEYYDMDMNPAAERVMPEWKVYFDGNFWGHHGRERAGTEIRLDREFDWTGHHWIVPAAYSCGKGLVVDFCMRTGIEEIRRFMEKWNLDLEDDQYREYTMEEQMRLDRDNPLCLDFRPDLKINGKVLKASQGCAVTFDPCLSDERNDEAAEWARSHYGLDSSFGWTIWRWVFPWSGKRRPKIQSFSLTLEQRPGRVPGPHFKVRDTGDSFVFSHPVNGTEYTLTVQGLEQQTIPEEHFDSKCWRYPTHFMAMRYTISPEVERDILICDCEQSDQPLKVTDDIRSFGPEARNSVGIGIIGGADGPTVVTVGERVQGKVHTACSALHFEPGWGDVVWRVDFNIRNFEGIVVKVI